MVKANSEVTREERANGMYPADSDTMHIDEAILGIRLNPSTDTGSTAANDAHILHVRSA